MQTTECQMYGTSLACPHNEPKSWLASTQYIGNTASDSYITLHSTLVTGHGRTTMCNISKYGSVYDREHTKS